MSGYVLKASHTDPKAAGESQEIFKAATSTT